MERAPGAAANTGCARWTAAVRTGYASPCVPRGSSPQRATAPLSRRTGVPAPRPGCAGVWELLAGTSGSGAGSRAGSSRSRGVRLGQKHPGGDPPPPICGVFMTTKLGVHFGSPSPVALKHRVGPEPSGGAGDVG